MSAGRVVVVGSINRDYVVRSPTVPHPGETVLGDELTLVSGGKGANQAVAAAVAGAHTRLVGCVGDDADGAASLADLEQAGVDVTEVRVLSGVRTGAAFITVAAGGENAIVVAPGANSRLDAQHVRESLSRVLGEHDVVVVQAEILRRAMAAAVEEAARRSARVVLNLAPYREIDEAVIAAADPLVVNRGEAEAFVGTSGDTAMIEASDPRRRAEQLSQRARSVVITVGADGAVVADGRSLETVAAAQVDVVDTTGAGDALVGALAAALAEGLDLRTAVQRGVDAGTRAVTHPGARRSVT